MSLNWKAVLGYKSGDTLQDLATKRRKLLARLHPNRGANAAGEARYKQLSEAYEEAKKHFKGWNVPLSPRRKSTSVRKPRLSRSRRPYAHVPPKAARKSSGRASSPRSSSITTDIQRVLAKYEALKKYLLDVEKYVNSQREEIYQMMVHLVPKLELEKKRGVRRPAETLNRLQHIYYRVKKK